MKTNLQMRSNSFKLNKYFIFFINLFFVLHIGVSSILTRESGSVYLKKGSNLCMCLKQLSALSGQGSAKEK